MKDKKIIDLFFERSENAITEVSKKYGGICMQTSFNIVNDWCDAEECVNDSYLSVWNAIPPHQPNRLLAFVLKIVRNISINCHKHKLAQKRKGNYELCIEELGEVISSPHSIEDEFEALEMTKLIDLFLDTLSVENRKLFVRRYWYMDSHSDLSIITGMMEGTIRTKLSRLRNQLKIFLKNKGVSL